jgi:hypothetical protein
MGYEQYKKKIAPLCPVAVKLGQAEVCAPGHNNWGVVTCDAPGCGAKFAIGPDMIYGSRISDVQAAKDLASLLTEDHKRNSPHQNAYELKD